MPLTGAPVLRRLAAILIADVVGYSRLMERDDTGTFARLRTVRDEIVDPAIVSNGGRIVKTAGDGLVAEFPSALAALRAAIGIQQKMAVREATSSADQRIAYRVGINLGDVIIDGDDIAGDGVNVASRLESLAEPGGICVSSSVYEQVHGNLDAVFVDIGEQRVKNIARSIRVFAVDLHAATGSPKGRETVIRRMPAIRSTIVIGLTVAVIVAALGAWLSMRPFGVPALPLAIAILPLSSNGTQAADATLADDITRDLRVAAGRSLRNVRHITVSRANRHDDRPSDARATARALGARYLVEGDVARANQLDVELQLIDGEVGIDIWHTRVQVTLSDATADRRVLVNRVAWRLRNAIFNAEIARAAAGRAATGEPSDLTARAYASWGEDLATMRVARRLFDDALRIDPNYVPALLGRAWTLNDEFEDDPAANRDATVNEMDELSRRATNIDPDNGDAWRTRATAFAWQGRYESALEASTRAITLDPSNKNHLINRAWIMDVSGRAEEAPAILEQARAIDPEDYGYEFNIACEANVLLARFKEAAVSCAKAAALENWSQNQVWLIAALARLDDSIALESAKRELLRKQPHFTIGGFRAQQRSRQPVYVRQVEENFYAGLLKAGLPQ